VAKINHVGRLGAGLPAEAAAGERHEGRITETPGGIARYQHTIAMAATPEYDGTLDNVGNNRDTVGAIHQPGGNILIGRGAQFLKYLCGSDQPCIFAGLRECRAAR
jgi:hypothetical protein